MAGARELVEAIGGGAADWKAVIGSSPSSERGERVPTEDAAGAGAGAEAEELSDDEPPLAPPPSRNLSFNGAGAGAGAEGAADVGTAAMSARPSKLWTRARRRALNGRKSTLSASRFQGVRSTLSHRISRPKPRRPPIDSARATAAVAFSYSLSRPPPSALAHVGAKNHGDSATERIAVEELKGALRLLVTCICCKRWLECGREIKTRDWTGSKDASLANPQQAEVQSFSGLGWPVHCHCASLV